MAVMMVKVKSESAAMATISQVVGAVVVVVELVVVIGSKGEVTGCDRVNDAVGSV